MEKKLKKIVVILSIMVLFFCIITLKNSVLAITNDNTEVWDGTIEEPTSTRIIDNETYYEIENAKQLAYLAEVGGEWLNKNYILTNDIVLNDVEIEYNKENGELITDSNLLRKWTPIAFADDENFTGIFDGNNHSILGMYINDDDIKEVKSIRVI